jgi:hypothetical protein
MSVDYSLFDKKAPGVIAKLMDAFKLTELQAAAILGNIGHECAGFTQLQERNPRGGRGGYGWAQWTGPRRRAFEEYCQEKRVAPESDEANYGFLQHELSTTEHGAISALRGQDDLINTVITFERVFERAGVKHYMSRIRWARRALTSYNKLMFELDGVEPIIEIPEEDYLVV